MNQQHIVLFRFTIIGKMNWNLMNPNNYMYSAIKIQSQSFGFGVVLNNPHYITLVSISQTALGYLVMPTPSNFIHTV